VPVDVVHVEQRRCRALVVVDVVVAVVIIVL